MRAQLFGLIRPGFVTATGPSHLGDLPRYLRGIGRRLEKLPANPARDRTWMAEIQEVQAEYDDLRSALPPHRRDAPDVVAVRWLIEELRISLFAQDLRTPVPVSAVRLFRAMDALR
jgi:ATP-dependent helicase HrpA